MEESRTEDGELTTSSEDCTAWFTKLTFRIRKDRISGHSIKLPGISAIQMPTLSSMSIMGLGSSTASTDREGGKDGKRDNDSSGEEQWTRACRAVLAVLKRILVVESEADRTTVAASAPAHA